jgi:peptidoglycan/xylan/chitin deacetylase (PgdA/CDA1 family)
MNEAQKAAAAGAGAAAAAVGTAIFLGQYPTMQVYGKTIHREPGAGRRIAMTFDDGPNPKYTPGLLELLARHDAKATFFLIGEWAEREPALIREIVAAGHAIGNHTNTHVTMPAHPAKRIREELRRGLRRDVLDGRRRLADASALRAPASRHAEDDAGGGIRPGDVVDHVLRLARAHDHKAHHAPWQACQGRRHHPPPRR